MKNLFLILLLGLLTNSLKAQTSVPFDSLHWEMKGTIVKENFKGTPGIRLTEGQLLLKDRSFKNGIIEFDVRLTKTSYFPSLNFRIEDEQNFESIYLRPHQIGNPDAIQYTPVFHGQPAWQLYHGEGYSAAVTYPTDEWVHIKVLVKDNQAEVYVNHPDQPTLVIHQLKRTAAPGGISLGNDTPNPTNYANFSYQKLDTPPFQGKFLPEDAPKPGTIRQWQVSSPFAEKNMINQVTLPKELTEGLKWQTLSAENSGTLNVARITKVGPESNTVFTKITITADQPQVKKLRLGFSDRVRVYCNGRLLYAGQDEFRSRDYRFLGTIGYFDEVYLALRKGKNELWIALSENFGGWGLKAQLEDPDGLEIR